MNRKCLLTGAYASDHMTLNGKPVYFSYVAQEIITELKCAGFDPDVKDQSQYHGLSEAIMIMYYLSNGQKGKVAEMRKMERDERHKQVNDFILEHSEAIEPLMEELSNRVDQALAASTEGDGPGKPEPALASPQ